MKKPIIGISGSLIIDNGGMFPGYERAYVNNDYVQSVVRAGGIPYIIPMVYDDEVIREQISHVDGVIMSGGHDVNPLLYGEEPRQELGGIMPRRDTFDMKLIRNTIEMNKPLVGICRGEQILNVTFGGTLYQDLKYIDGCFVKHNQGALPDYPTHTVEVERDSKLANIIGTEIRANSFHHLAVKDVAPGFKIVARGKDGVVEAIEREGDLFVLGLQWHPEMLSAKYEKMQAIFNKLVEEASK